MRPAHTYSIVARDPASGALGVAVQSHYFCVGPVVPWAQAGAGAVATQAMVEVGYGPRALERMQRGAHAPEALAELLAADPQREIRQVAAVDAHGRVAAHTGARCIAHAGHRLGEQYSAQANMMLRPGVVDAMALAFEGATGELADRLVAALAAAEEAGGDVRGRQSAALLVVRGAPSGEPWRDRLAELRVEDHADPVAELRRLLTLQQAFDHMREANAALERGELEAYVLGAAEARRLAPHSVEIGYWLAVGLAARGRMDEAVPLLKQIFEEDGRWPELLRRLPAAGILPEALVLELLQATGES